MVKAMQNGNERSEQLPVRVQSDLMARIKQAAAEARQPVSWWVRDALEERLARVEAETAGQSRRKSSAKRPER